MQLSKHLWCCLDRFKEPTPTCCDTVQGKIQLELYEEFNKRVMSNMLHLKELYFFLCVPETKGIGEFRMAQKLEGAQIKSGTSFLLFF